MTDTLGDLTKDATQKAKGAAYAAATTRLRHEYRERFQALLGEEHASRGLEYKPRLTRQDRAARQVADLLAEFPDLKERFVEV